MGMATPTPDNESTKGPRQPTLLEYARWELQDLIALAVKYQDLIKTAKTGAKKTFYKKKLKKNNLKVLQMTAAVEKLRNKDGDTSHAS